jgi:hypothetical protein
MRWILKPFKAIAVWTVALLLLFEEWGWEPLQRLAAWISRWPPLAAIERRIAALPPRAALAVFALPALALLPVKFAALWLISIGHALLGVMIIVAAKILGTALVARLFKLTEPALMRMAWFALWHGRWTVWKDALLARVRASRAWRMGAVLRRQAGRAWRRLQAAIG